MQVALEPVTREQCNAFQQVAEAHFRELDSNFVPQDDWKQNYFDRIQSNPRFCLRWIVADGKRVGFVLYGVEEHRFLSITSGWIYELYVQPEFRRQGVARISAQQAIAELKMQSSRVQLEITEGNRGAMALWKSLGFHKLSERWVLPESRH